MTQASKVHAHLKSRGKLTSVEAFGLYGITRLAAVVGKMKANGLAILTTMKKGVHGRYAEYRLKPNNDG